MDLEDEGWVNIPYDGLLEIHDDEGKKFFSRKYVRSTSKLFKMDYFDSSSWEDKQLMPLPIGGGSSVDHPEGEVKEITKHMIREDLKPEADQDPVFQVFFKKENEFVEMKMGSQGTTLSQIETNKFQHEEKSEDYVFNMSSPSKLKGDDGENLIPWGENNERLNFWKWGLSGIGAFCSLGMAMATICIIVFGNGQRRKQHNQNLRIEFYSENKRINQLMDNANKAIKGVNGVPLAKAHITYGGYYEDL